MENYIAITTLNDFIFCPYSIYLHEIYNLNKEETYHSSFQSKGKRLHGFIENNKDENDWKHAYVYSEKLSIYGKIDDYNPVTKELVEYKSTLSIAFQGYYYQIWAQYLCLLEMGIEVKKLAFFDFKSNQKIPIALPNINQINELKKHIKSVKEIDFHMEIKVNTNKCNHCIYSNLCEKTNE